jgi:NTE family protein
MPDERHRADGVFEGGGVKGIAFAGAIASAERDAGVQEWVNLAGTSAGSIVAALLAVGYDSAGLQKILGEA